MGIKPFIDILNRLEKLELIEMICHHTYDDEQEEMANIIIPRVNAVLRNGL